MKYRTFYQFILYVGLGWAILVSLDTIALDTEDLSGLCISSSFSNNTAYDITHELRAYDTTSGQVNARIVQQNPCSKSD